MVAPIAPANETKPTFIKVSSGKIIKCRIENVAIKVTPNIITRDLSVDFLIIQNFQQK